jgi:hypothetical protein
MLVSHDVLSVSLHTIRRPLIDTSSSAAVGHPDALAAAISASVAETMSVWPMHGLKKSSIKSFRHGDQSRRPQPDRTVSKIVGHNDLLAGD